MNKETKIALTLIGGMVTIILFLMLAPFEIINTGNKGVLYNWGAVSDIVLDEGFQWRLPIKQTIKEISIQPKQMDNIISASQSGAITQDNQTIGAEMNIFYTFNKEHLIPMLKGYGEEKLKSIISKTILENFKKTIGDYSIFEVASKQEEIKMKVFEGVAKDMESYPVIINEIKINNYDWSDQFDRQIETTMEKAQQVKQAEQELLITQQQAQKQVKEAEAAKQATITRAQGEKEATITRAEGEREAAKLIADAKALQGEGIKKYNQSIAANLEIELQIRKLEIEKIKAEKWSGNLVPSQVFTPIPLNLNGTMQGFESVK